MSVDTLTAAGAAVTIGPPAADENGDPSTFLGYVAEPGADEIITLTESHYPNNPNSAPELTATGYDLSGNVLFRTVLFDEYTVEEQGPPVGLNGPTMVLLANGEVAIAWNNIYYSSPAGGAGNSFALVTSSGTATTGAADAPDLQHFAIEGQPFLAATATGLEIAWNAETQPMAPPPAHYAYQTVTYDMVNHTMPQSTTQAEQGFDNSPPSTPTALNASGSATVQLSDNLLQFYESNALVASANLPGEPAHALTQEAAAILAGGHSAAVTWIDSGADHVSIYDASTNSFSDNLTIDWGGASDAHVVALPDGGFAVSWMKDGAYYGGVFDAAGDYGGKISLAGEVAGINSAGQLYTVAQDANGNEVVQTYAISGSGGSTGGGSTGGGGTSGGSSSSVSTSDPDYTAPDGVTTITLTGSNQTVHANNAGDTIFSDDTKNVLIGGTGADTFHIGRAGDTVTGGGGNDTFAYAEVPWGGSTITDFQNGDVLDLTGLMQTTHDTGTDGFADGYLKIANDGSGNTQVWANYNLPGNNNWWLVATLDGVFDAKVETSGNTVVWAGASSGATAYTDASYYAAPDGVSTIYLIGAGQTIHANNAGDTIWSNDNRGPRGLTNHLFGGTGDDTFHVGRAGDVLTGGGGNDTFAYATIPWAGSEITDFHSGDVIDLTGMLADQHYAGSDPFADGYLKLDADSAGHARIWANYNQPDNNGWWTVAWLDGVSTSSLHYANGLIT